MKKVFFVCGFLTAVSAFAQDSGTTIDLSPVGSVASSLADSFVTVAIWFFLPSAFVVITYAVVLWIGPKIPGLISLGKKRG